MQTLSKSELQTIKYICSLTQEELSRSLTSVLRKAKYKPVVTKDYIYAEGSIPIALVAHMDTVFLRTPHEIFYDTTQNVMWSPQGLGADDRAGVYAILQIIKAGLRPHIIFTTDEEKGGLGSLTLSEKKCPFKDLRYIIQLDRQGNSDCVFYDCDNPEFTKYVESFGFIEAYGSFTDISNLCPEWGIAGVNLSVGYRDEHSKEELLFINGLNSTIQRVINMISIDKDDIPRFKYIEVVYSWRKRYLGHRGEFMSVPYKTDLSNYYSGQKKCAHCNQYYDEEDLFPILDYDGTEKDYCYNCTPEDARWCMKCGRVFRSHKDTNLCDECWGELVKDGYIGNRENINSKTN